MEASIRLGTIRGILVGIHYSWFIVFFGLSALLALGQYPDLYPDWSDAAYWVVGIVSVLLLFLSVLLHELGHSIVAQRLGIPVISITLFIFGGVAAISRESETPGDEFKIAIAGPVVSVLVGFVSLMSWLAIGDASEHVSAILLYIAVINIALAVFNMIPGFPLDGGRVLRAILWRVTGSMRRATRVVSTIGTLFGMLLLSFGLLTIFLGNAFSGIYLIAIGWFLQNAAQQGQQQVELDALLSDVAVSDLMRRDPVTVRPDATILELVHEYVLGRNVRGVPVSDDGEVIGIITVTDIKNVPQDAWPMTRVSEVMTGSPDLKTVTEQTPMRDVLQLMGSEDFHQLPVMENGRLVGLISRSEIVRHLQFRHDLNVDR